MSNEKMAFVDKSRVEPTIFFIEKISFSLKLFSVYFYGQSFIKTVRGPLPLSGEGFFGLGLEKLLQSRKEKKKQLENLVPELKRKPYKHRSDSPSRSLSDNKRP